MGWSCSAAALKTLERTLKQFTDGETSTGYIATGGRYFVDGMQDVEHADGSITAQVWKIMGPKGSCKKVGGLHISPDGSIKRWTAIPAPWRHTTNADAELKSLGMPGYF